MGLRVLTNTHDPPAEGNFCGNCGKAIKPQIVVDYNRHMGYVDKGYRMRETYSINRRTRKWTKKLFYHLYSFSVHVCYFHYLLPTHAQLIKTLHTSHLKFLHVKMSMLRSKTFNKKPTCFG